MSTLQDKVNGDLKRFMYDEMPDNVEDLRATFKDRLVAADTAKIGVHRERTKEIQFTVHLRNEIAKSKPHDLKRRRGLVMYGMVFLLLAMVAVTLLPPPISWVMAGGCFVPLILSTVIMVRRKRTKQEHARQH